jgi:ketosteroid isomerase-like protein
MKTPSSISAAILAVAFALSISAPRALEAQAQASSAATASVQAQIEANNRAVGRAIGTSDFAALEKLWAPRMVVNSPGNNILTRDQVFEAMRHDELKYSSVKGTTETFFVSGDIAVEMGHEDIVMANGPMAGKPLRRRYTNIWQKSGDSWFQVARQATYVGVDGGAVYGHPDLTLSH